MGATWNLRQSVWSWRPSNHVWISICPNVFSAIFRIQTKNIREKARCECKLKQKYFDFSNIFIILAHAGWEESRDIDDCFSV